MQVMVRSGARMLFSSRRSVLWAHFSGRLGTRRSDSLQFGVGRGHHEVSLKAGAKISTSTIRPWWQTGHCLKERPVSCS